MKEIRAACLCGSSITFQDQSESPINRDSSPDSSGRKFLIEVRADEWLARHQKCVDTRVKILSTPQKKSKEKS